MYEKTQEKSEMLSELAYASDAMKNRIAPPGSAPSKGERIRKAARLLRWKYSRAAAVWYGDERVSIKPHELRTIEEVSGVKFGKQEVREVDELIKSAEALLVGQDANFQRAFAAGLRAFARALDRPRAGKDG